VDYIVCPWCDRVIKRGGMNYGRLSPQAERVEKVEFRRGRVEELEKAIDIDSLINEMIGG